MYILQTRPIKAYVTYSHRYEQMRNVLIAINSSNDTTHDFSPQRQDDTSFRKEGHAGILGRICHLKNKMRHGEISITVSSRQ